MTPPFHPPRERAAALVIVLAFVVLLSGVVVAYFSRALANRQMSASSFHQTKVDELARSALDIVTSDLKQELAASGTASTSGSVTLYLGTAPSPVRNGVPMASGTYLFPTLLRVSTATGTTGLVDHAASPALSTGTSANGRYVSPTRWNRHYLLPRQNPANTLADSEPAAAFVPPQWVFVTSTGGPVPLATPSRSVMGRYAYAIYDEGALLDINVAGYPSALPASTPDPSDASRKIGYGGKGSLAFADLTQLSPSLTGTLVDQIVGWRNYISAQATGSFGAIAVSSGVPYYNAVLSNTTGFLTVSGTGDQAVLSRQALLSLRNALGFDQNALQYLGTFSRTATAPSWMPPASPANANPAAANLRFAATTTYTHYRADGTAETLSVRAGDPFLQHRFSLAKLAWLTDNGPATGKANAIRACFGLSWNNAKLRWDYVGAAGSTPQTAIKTLAEVRAESPAREPNFFELLKAGILTGSLGKAPGAVAAGPLLGYVGVSANVEGPTGIAFDYTSAVSDLQILQIGANIIDQQDAGNNPTALYLNAQFIAGGMEWTPDSDNYSADEIDLFKTVFGIENLPYLAKLMQITASRDAATAPNPPSIPTRQMDAWLQPVLWNPHQNPNSTTGQHAIPAHFRVRAHGQMMTWNVFASPANAGSAPVDYNGADAGLGLIAFDLSSTQWADLYKTPVALSSTNATITTDDKNLWSTYNLVDTTNKFAAFWSGEVDYAAFSASLAATSNQIHSKPNYHLTVALEYQDSLGNWRPYNVMARIALTKAQNYASANKYGRSSPKVSTARPDPRTDRFSAGSIDMGGSNDPYNTSPSTKETFMPNSASPKNLFGGYPRPGAGFTYNITPNPASDTNKLSVGKGWSLNLSGTGGNGCYYADPDGAVRPGDAFLSTSDTEGFLLYHSTSATADTASQHSRRAVILNRPFRSVGELGYVFRDLPFKSLDFFSANSADGALLDLFAVTDEPSITAGQVNLNNAPAPVLQAILARTLKNEAVNPALLSGTATVSGTSEAALIAQQLAAQLAASPLRNRAELPAAVEATVKTLSGSIPDLVNKACAEAPVRALAPVANTRTWNLLVDLIAQTGSFPPTSAATPEALNSAFVVQGERRYWLHIAIDRITGKVVGQQLEVVYE